MSEQPQNDPGDEYDPDEEGPEAKLFRDDLTADIHVARQIDKLLESLKPEDAHRHLFSYQEMVDWNLKHKRFRRP